MTAPGTSTGRSPRVILAEALASAIHEGDVTSEEADQVCAWIDRLVTDALTGQPAAARNTRSARW